MDAIKWEVINLTDGIIALPGTTKELAEIFVKEFPNTFRAQGYYLTASGTKIKPEEVRLEIRTAE